MLPWIKLSLIFDLKTFCVVLFVFGKDVYSQLLSFLDNNIITFQSLKIFMFSQALKVSASISQILLLFLCRCIFLTVVRKSALQIWFDLIIEVRYTTGINFPPLVLKNFALSCDLFPRGFHACVFPSWKVQAWAVIANFFEITVCILLAYTLSKDMRGIYLEVINFLKKLSSDVTSFTWPVERIASLKFGLIHSSFFILAFFE